MYVPEFLALFITYIYIYTGWPKEVSHYQKLSLNRIKNRQCHCISHQFRV